VSHDSEVITDIGILYQEKLIDGKINFIPKVEKIENLDAYFGHKIIQANKLEVFNPDGKLLKVNSENVFVMIDNENISLLPK
jgi:hypothetical protein